LEKRLPLTVEDFKNQVPIPLGISLRNCLDHGDIAPYKEAFLFSWMIAVSWGLEKKSREMEKEKDKLIKFGKKALEDCVDFIQVHICDFYLYIYIYIYCHYLYYIYIFGYL
jgi:hypothetical protein